MSEGNQKNGIKNSVTQFYRGKSILLTGATGFLGAVLLETLLRCCIDIKTIYILIRAKKGVNPKNRKAELFKRSIFNRLIEENPKVFDKVHVLEGDVSVPSMGMSEEDLRDVIRNVTIVFHCAGSTSFSKPLRYLMLHNAVGADNALELCKKLKRCEVLVYTSAAYSSNNRKCKIEERVYRLPHPAEKFTKATIEGNNDKLQKLVSVCKPDWPNAFAFSKCVAENVLVENGSAIPIAIIRPSLIAHTWKGILPGYAAEKSKLIRFFMGIAKGFIKVVHASSELNLDFVPVDVVANSHIIAAWALGTGRRSSPVVVNCTSGGSYSSKLGDISHFITSISLRNPPPNTFRYTDFCWIVEHWTTFQFLSIFVHYIPAAALDLLLIITRDKPRVVSMYRYLDRKMATSKFLLRNSWTYETENLKSLQCILSAPDKNMFYTELENLDVDNFMRKLETGAPFYDWKTDHMFKFDRMRRARRTFHFTQSVQGIVAFLICCSFYAIFYQATRMCINY